MCDLRRLPKCLGLRWPTHLFFLFVQLGPVLFDLFYAEVLPTQGINADLSCRGLLPSSLAEVAFGRGEESFADVTLVADVAVLYCFVTD